MRYIKNIHLLYLLLTFVIGGTNQVKAQQLTLFSPYEGTWHYQEGNELFIVSLWQENDGVFRGYYKKVAYSNGTIGSTIFNSRKVYDDGVAFPPTISGDFNVESGIYGFISDNTMDNNPKDFKRGSLHMQINSDTSCSGCPITATWKIEERSGLRVNFIEGFSIPTDVILTKASNEIDLE